MADKIKVFSEMEVTLKVIGGKWKLLILHFLQYEGSKRYNEILRFLGTAPKKTLTIQLRELEEDGIITRTVIPTVPIQVEYSITKHGESLYPILKLMCVWGEENAGERYEITHATCGEKGDKKLKK